MLNISNEDVSDPGGSVGFLFAGPEGRLLDSVSGKSFMSITDKPWYLTAVRYTNISGFPTDINQLLGKTLEKMGGGGG